MQKSEQIHSNRGQIIDMALQLTGSLTSCYSIVLYLKLWRFWIIVFCIYSSFVFVAGVFSTAKVLAINTATSAATQAGYSIGGRLALQALNGVSGPGEQQIPAVSTWEKLKQIPAAFQFVPTVDKLRMSCSILAVIFPRLIR